MIFSTSGKLFGTLSNDFGTLSNDFGTSGIVFGTLSKTHLALVLYLALGKIITILAVTVLSARERGFQAEPLPVMY